MLLFDLHLNEKETPITQALNGPTFISKGCQSELDIQTEICYEHEIYHLLFCVLIYI